MAKKRKWDESKVTRDEAGRFSGGGYTKRNGVTTSNTTNPSYMSIKREDKFVGGRLTSRRQQGRYFGGNEPEYRASSRSRNGVFNRSESWKQANNQAELARLRRLAEGR